MLKKMLRARKLLATKKTQFMKLTSYFVNMKLASYNYDENSCEVVSDKLLLTVTLFVSYQKRLKILRADR